MKCFNLTDVETEELKSRGLVNMTLVVRSVVIHPGEFAEVPEDSLHRAAASGYVSLGALSVEVLPPAYVLRKERMQKVVVPVAPMARVRRSS